MTTANADEDAEKPDRSYITGGNAKRYGQPTEQFGTYHTTSNCTPGHLSQRTENWCSHRNLHRNVHSSFIHNSQKVEFVWMSFHRWMVKPVHPIRATLLHGINSEKLSACATAWINLQRIMLSENSQFQKPTNCTIPLTWHFGNKKKIEMECSSGLAIARH